MGEHKMEDPDKILKKVTNTPFMGVIALIVSIVFLLMCLYGIITINESGAFIFVIVGGLLFIIFLSIYLFQKGRIKKNIKNIDLDKVRKEIMEGVVSFDFCKTYFTKSYVLSNFYYGFIIDYKDILWVYKRTLYDPNTLLPRYDLVICPKNGKKYYTEYYDAFIEEIVKHNKSILVGNDRENKSKYKELIKNINN